MASLQRPFMRSVIKSVQLWYLLKAIMIIFSEGIHQFHGILKTLKTNQSGSKITQLVYSQWLIGLFIIRSKMKQKTKHSISLTRCYVPMDLISSLLIIVISILQIDKTLLVHAIVSQIFLLVCWDQITLSITLLEILAACSKWLTSWLSWLYEPFNI